jgi:solute carrier family 25 (mitochondrial folate transporter), member 32
MQVIDDKAGTYRSLTKAFRTVLSNEGVHGLYQGVTPALFAASGSWGGYFYFYELSKQRKLGSLEENGALRTVHHVSNHNFGGFISFLSVHAILSGFYCSFKSNVNIYTYI